MNGTNCVQQLNHGNSSAATPKMHHTPEVSDRTPSLGLATGFDHGDHPRKLRSKRRPRRSCSDDRRVARSWRSNGFGTARVLGLNFGSVEGEYPEDQIDAEHNDKMSVESEEES